MTAAETFTGALRDLWIEADRPSSRTLARLTRLPHPTIDGWISRGRTPVVWDDVAKVIKALGGDPSALMTLWATAKGELDYRNRFDTQRLAEVTATGLADVAAAIRGRHDTELTHEDVSAVVVAWNDAGTACQHADMGAMVRAMVAALVARGWRRVFDV